MAAVGEHGPGVLGGARRGYWGSGCAEVVHPDLCLCGFMNFAAALRGEATPKEGGALTQRGAGPNAAAGSACLPSAAPFLSSLSSAGPAEREGGGHWESLCGRSVRPSASEWFEQCQTLGVTARDVGDAGAMTAPSRAWRRRYLE